VTSVSLQDSLDSTLDNEKKAHTVPRTSGDMDTIPEMTGERTTTTPGNTEALEVESEGDESSDDVENGRVAVASSRRPSTIQIGFTLPNDHDVTNTHSSNMSAKDFAGKTTSGQLYSFLSVAPTLCQRVYSKWWFEWQHKTGCSKLHKAVLMVAVHIKTQNYFNVGFSCSSEALVTILTVSCILWREMIVRDICSAFTNSRIVCVFLCGSFSVLIVSWRQMNLFVWQRVMPSAHPQ